VNHPETMLQLVRDRQNGLAKEAQRDRLVRAANAAKTADAAIHEEKHERFSVRGMRWILFRPSGA
jgi:hypothetical protein